MPTHITSPVHQNNVSQKLVASDLNASDGGADCGITSLTGVMLDAIDADQLLFCNDEAAQVP